MIEVELTKREAVELARISDEANRKIRIFWVKTLKKRGYTNVSIAKELELSESTVRKILKG